MGKSMIFYVLILWSSKWARWVIFGQKSTSLNFSLNLLIRFFWNCIWWHVFKNGWKWQFGFLRKKWQFGFLRKTVISKIGEMSHFWAQISVNLFIRFFLNCTWWQVLMIVVYYKGKSYYADNGSKSSSVGVEGSLLFQACFCCSNLGHNKLIFCYTQTRACSKS